jgi:hypothetical protein
MIDWWMSVYDGLQETTLVTIDEGWFYKPLGAVGPKCHILAATTVANPRE